MTAPGVPALIWPGGAALSGFRLEKLLRDCQARVPAVTGVAARFLHVVELSELLTARTEQTLQGLLDDGSAAGSELPDAHLLVLPRTGTVSPWSSKATDIARSCGLDGRAPR